MDRKLYHAQLMLYYDEVLAQSVRNYAFTNESIWEKRYLEVEPILDKLLKDVIKTADPVNRDFFSQMYVIAKKLVEIESKAFDLVNQGKEELSIYILDSKKYQKQRKILVDGLKKFVTERFRMEENLEMMGTGNLAVRDIISLERRLAVLEKQLEHEKLSAIGELSARMAHDLRNPLFTIKVSMENLRRLYGIDKKKQLHFDRIERSIDRMLHQVDDVLNFVKGEPSEINRVEISKILSESMDSIDIPNGIHVILPKNDTTLLCDQKQFSIALNNLILNAIQAIEGEGTVEIIVDENDESIIIKVKDSGIGIPPDSMNEIFDPLFTTKTQGTGLGLASVKSIIKFHGGIITVTSPPTVFKITMPKIEQLIA